MYNVPGWKFRIEYDFSDFPIKRILSDGCQLNSENFSIVNSNGIANDPTGRNYERGGGIVTPWTQTWEEQIDIFRALRKSNPEARINYRSRLRVEVRIPQLKRDLSRLKLLNNYIYWNARDLLEIIAPYHEPMPMGFSTKEEHMGSRDFWENHSRVFLERDTFDRQGLSNSWQQFFELEALWDSRRKRSSYELVRKGSISLRQMLYSDSVDFRFFPGTMNSRLVGNCMQWCVYFLLCAFDRENVRNLKRQTRLWEFPKNRRYQHDLEIKYQKTRSDGSMPARMVARNIERILRKNGES